MMRTSNCGELQVMAIDREVTLAGWVATYRDHGDLLFIDLRDRWGITQIVFNPKENAALHEKAKKLRPEYVIQVKGLVARRPAGTTNKKIPTGEIEVKATALEVLNASPTPPFELSNSFVNEELRLRYRFLDLRRKDMVEGMAFRYRVTKIVRDYLDREGFLEIETPYLTRSTPEGARDFLVPSRLSPNTFYALPQSPQLFKQLLMVAGYDRYYQLARCFRDEDLRKDRQPEHTQIDLEMSFVDDEDVMRVVEGMIAEVFEKAIGIKLQKPFRRLSYGEALARYGSEAPDLRYGMELVDLTPVLEASGFKVFDSVIEKKGKVRGLCLTPPGGKDYTRKEFDDLTKWILDYGAKGLAWFEVKEAGRVESPLQKFFDQDRVARVLAAMKAKPGDILFMVAADERVSATALGALRAHLAEGSLALSQNRFEVLWVRDFPLLEYNEEEKRFQAVHHPFTSPRLEDLPLLETDPAKVRARAYDLVLNGTEIGGGSIRIHREDIQEKVFRAIGLGPAEAKKRFGFLLDALRYGAPPHGGLAIGLDRFVAILLGRESIREVIAFPKTQKGTCLMTEAPAPVEPKQLAELHLGIKK